uniref:Uncharacterized protein n=1 Tax=Oryza punctata TaxID=4537 RepID=A0A0E0M4V6_ORYPU
MAAQENAGRSATARCPQGVINSGRVMNRPVGVSRDAAELAVPVDDKALPNGARSCHHPSLAGKGHRHSALPEYSRWASEQLSGRYAEEPSREA